METLPSFVVLLVMLVPFCVAQNNEFRDNDNKELMYPRNVEATWKKFMVRMLKNIRINREAERRELILSQVPFPATVEPQGEDLGISKNVDKAVCNQYGSCSVSETITGTDHQSSTGTTNTSSNNSNSNNSNSSSSTSTSGGGTATSSNNSSSSSSSSGG